MNEEFKPIDSPKGLGWILNYKLKDLKIIASSVDNYYRKWYKRKLNPDKTPLIINGKIQKREINESYGQLKIIQRRIHKRILKSIKLPKNVLGGISPYNTVINAFRHKGKKYHFQTDIKKFFPSITNKRVFNTFNNLGFSPPVCSLLTKLTTKEGNLPQGTPTSTSIANIVFHPIDIEIIKFCDENKITYTRWVDDLNFSAKYDFNEIILQITKIIKDSGFNINNIKTQYKIGPITMTGIITKNNTLTVPQELYNRVKDNSIPEKSRESLQAYINSVHRG